MSPELASVLEFFVVVFGELAVLFAGVSFLVSAINQKLPPEKIKTLLSGNRGYGIAVALGAVTPFCSCSTLPMTVGLIQARAAFGPIMAFLFTSPLLNPFIVGLFWVSFGGKVTLIYMSFVVLLSVLSGVLLARLNFERFVRTDLFEPKCQAIVKSGKDCESNDDQREVLSVSRLDWHRLAVDAFTQFKSFAPYMIIGVMVGAVLHGYVPQSAFERLSELSIIWLIPLAAIIGVFLYVRASTMVPIATSLASKGLAMGAIMSLTIAGAGASLPEMIMMKRMFHWPLVFAFIFLVFTTACVTGFAIELFLSPWMQN